MTQQTRRLRCVHAASLGVLLLACAFLVSAADLVRQVKFDIPAQPLLSALYQFSTQANVQVVSKAVDISDVASHGVSGVLSIDKGLGELLKDTGYAFTVVDSSTVAITPVQTSGAGEAAADLHLAISKVQSAENQSSAAASSEKSASAGESSKDGAQEVLVTATKRSVPIQAVPISITAITSEEIARRGLVSSEDYLRGVPGVNQTEGTYPGQQSIVIRGLATTLDLQNYGAGTTVATYFGETPTTNSAGLFGGSAMDLKLIDIERVEVLRGPQGTAFGNSSMSGAVRTIPVAPKLDRIEGKADVGYSATSGTGGDNYNVSLVGNLPLMDGRLAIRASGYQYENSVFNRNIAGSDAAFRTAVVNRYSAQAFAVDEEEVGTARATGGRIAALFRAGENLALTVSYMKQQAELDGLPGSRNNRDPYDQTALQVAPEHVLRGQRGGASDADIDLANAVIEYDLGWAELVATYSNVTSNAQTSYSYTGLGIDWAASYLSDSDHRENVGEVRIATRFGGPLNFLAGVYVEDVKDKVGANYLWYGDPATSIFADKQRFLGELFDRRRLRQKAAFGEASWEIVSGLTLEGGVRAYDYDRELFYDADGAPFFRSGIHLTKDTQASGASYRANLSYQFDDHKLLYASWSQGFRLGQLQRGLTPGTCDADNNGIIDGTAVSLGSTRELNSDSVDSYEIGAKLAFLDRRLTISADVFRMDWEGLPVTVIVRGCNQGLSYVANAGSAVSQGVEFEANYRITGPLSVQVGGSWIDAELTEDVPAQGFLDGDRLPGSPKVNANLGLQYEFDLAGREAFVRVDSIYLGPFFVGIGGERNPASIESGDYLRLDTAAGIAFGRLNIDLFAHNLTNQDSYTYSGPVVGQHLRPRTVGLRLGYSFR